jgi:predicted methyltransferase
MRAGLNSRWWWLTIVAAIVGGCASPGTSRDETAAELEKILASDHRSPENRARDVYRHPRETLLFFDLRPETHVVEIWPATGWYTEVIAPLVNERGKYYAAQFVPDPKSQYLTNIMDQFRAKLAARPDLYGKVEVTQFGPGSSEIAPPGSVDLVLTFRNMHNWMMFGWTPEAFAAMYKALKPGGVLGVVEHRGDPNKPQDPQARSGYVNEDYAIQIIEQAGFKLVGKSEINANPRDTKDYEQGVWTLPPVYRLGEKDKEKYAAIGESDRFTLKFEKPKQSAP